MINFFSRPAPKAADVSLGNEKANFKFYQDEERDAHGRAPFWLSVRECFLGWEEEGLAVVLMGFSACICPIVLLPYVQVSLLGVQVALVRSSINLLPPSPALLLAIEGFPFQNP
jgi:hypothetical protein